MAKVINPRLLISVAWKIALLICLIMGGKYLSDWVLGQLTPYLTPSTEPALHRLIMTSISLYVLLMMLPFVPGVEIGLGMMVTFGPKIAPLVFAATVLSLSLSFLIGRVVPQDVIIDSFEALRLKRAASLLKNLQPLGTEERLEFILQSSSLRITSFLIKYRFIALIIALNLPGNAVAGGGGGICLIAGYCRLFPFPRFLLAVVLAVAPVPLAIFLTG